MRTFHPTDAERAQMMANGETSPLAFYSYCASCYALISNPETAIPLLRGLMESTARSKGVAQSTAEKLSDKFEAMLKGQKR